MEKQALGWDIRGVLWSLRCVEVGRVPLLLPDPLVASLFLAAATCCLGNCWLKICAGRVGKASLWRLTSCFWEACERCCPLCVPFGSHCPSAWPLTLDSTLLSDLPEDQLAALLSEPFHFRPMYQPLFPGPRVSSSSAAPYLVSDSAPTWSILIVPCSFTMGPIPSSLLSPLITGLFSATEGSAIGSHILTHLLVLQWLCLLWLGALLVLVSPNLSFILL